MKNKGKSYYKSKSFIRPIRSIPVLSWTNFPNFFNSSLLNPNGMPSDVGNLSMLAHLSGNSKGSFPFLILSKIFKIFPRSKSLECVLPLVMFILLAAFYEDHHVPKAAKQRKGKLCYHVWGRRVLLDQYRCMGA